MTEVDMGSDLVPRDPHPGAESEVEEQRSIAGKGDTPQKLALSFGWNS
jgi:hypothetical protein